MFAVLGFDQLQKRRFPRVVKTDDQDVHSRLLKVLVVEPKDQRKHRNVSTVDDASIDGRPRLN